MIWTETLDDLKDFFNISSLEFIEIYIMIIFMVIFI